MKAPRIVELRLRAAWVPGGSFRLELGRATGAALKRLAAQRTELRRLAVRGDWDVLADLKAGRLTVEQVLSTVDRFGHDDYRAHLPQPVAAGPVAPSLDEHVRAWLEDCDANPDLRRTSVRQYRAHIKRLTRFHVEGVRLGERPWHQVPRHTIRDARASLDLAPNTIRTVLGAWSAFFQWALEREESEAEHEGREPLVQANPVRRARVWSKVQTTRHRFLAHPEFARLLEVAPAPMRAQYATLALAGLRIEEMMVLPPGHMRLPRTIHVGRWGDWRPKVERSIRDVPIHPALLPMLEAYRDEYGGSDLAFFVNPATGRPWSYKAFTGRMRLDVVAAGMTYGAWTRGKGDLVRHADGVTPHTLRHSFGSWLAVEDVQLMKIAALMGDTEETVRLHYVHLLPGDLSAALSRIIVRPADRPPENLANISNV